MPITPLPPVAHVCKIRVRHQVGINAHVENVLHFDYDPTKAPLSLADAQTIANTFNGSWQARILPGLSVATTMIDVQATDLDTLTGVQATSAAGVAGGVAGTSVPAGTAMVVTLKTGLRGKSFRGRVYLAGLPQSDMVDASTWSDAQVDNFEVGFAQLTADMLAAAVSSRQCVVSYFSGSTLVPGEPPIPTRRPVPIATDVSTWIANDKPASQRRRNLQGA
jgi:hypothetical protein